LQNQKERKLQEERMQIKIPRKKHEEVEPPEVEIIEKDNDLGFRKGNKPKVMKT
jgi:hypothetical protein